MTDLVLRDGLYAQKPRVPVTYDACGHEGHSDPDRLDEPWFCAWCYAERREWVKTTRTIRHVEPVVEPPKVRMPTGTREQQEQRIEAGLVLLAELLQHGPGYESEYRKRRVPGVHCTSDTLWRRHGSWSLARDAARRL